MSSHPGRVRAVLQIDLPRPRGESARGSARFAQLTEQIWGLIREEAYRAIGGESTVKPAESHAVI